MTGRLSDRVRAVLSGAIRVYQADPRRSGVVTRLHLVRAGLDEPMRIAMAGTLKSGKSTLVNAMVGECIAPTDATEATRVVTWFRHGTTPRATATRVDGGRTGVPIVRGAGVCGGLTFDLGGLDPDRVVGVDVEWPAEELTEATIVDTPGTSSLSKDVSDRTLGLLVPPDGIPRVDAVVFLLRTLNAPDVALLKQIGHLVGGSAGALGVIGVVSRADEIGSGRIDAMLSARDVARRFTTELESTGICQAVVPVSGLLALTARTLRQDEFESLAQLAAIDAATLNKAMLSADRFVRSDPSLPVDAAARGSLLARFGMFGLRISIALLRSGVADSATLATDLTERSGLVALREVLDQHFAQRSDLLKSHTALLALRRIVETNPTPATPRILAEIAPLLADTHAFEELRLLSQLRSRPTTLTGEEMASLRRLIGGSGTDAAVRLGLGDRDADDGPRAAFAAAQRWRRRAEHPLNDPFTARACRAAVRSAEALVVQYAGRY